MADIIGSFGKTEMQGQTDCIVGYSSNTVQCDLVVYSTFGQIRKPAY